MSLRDQQDTIVCSPLLRPAASTSLNIPDDLLSSGISRKSKNSVIDRSVDDGTPVPSKRPSKTYDGIIVKKGRPHVHSFIANAWRFEKILCSSCQNWKRSSS
eukprot:04836_4